MSEPIDPDAAGQTPLRDWFRSAIDTWEGVPALLRDRHLTVIAANPLARALSPSFVPGVNLARFTFIDAESFVGRGSHEQIQSQVTAMLRDSLDQHDEDAPFRGLVGELSARSPAFAAEWAKEVRSRRSGVATFFARPVGTITLGYRELWIDETHDDVLMVWRGEDLESAGKLDELARYVSGVED